MEQQEAEKQSSEVMMQQEIENYFFEKYPTKKEFQRLYSIGIPRRYKVCETCHRKHDRSQTDCIRCEGLWECISRNHDRHKQAVDEYVKEIQTKYVERHLRIKNESTREYIATHRLKPAVEDEELKDLLSEAKGILGGKELSTPLRFSQVTMEFAKVAKILQRKDGSI